MASDDPDSDTEFQACMGTTRQGIQFVRALSQFLERVEPWLQQSVDLKEPEETLRREKERLQLKFQKAVSEVHTYLEAHGFSDPSGGTPEPNGRLQCGMNEVATSLAELKALHRGYGRMIKGQQKIYVRQMKALKDIFPGTDNPILNDALRQLFPLPASMPRSPSPASLASPAVSGVDSSRAPSPEPQASVGDPEHAAEDAHSSNEEEDNINAAGTFTAAGRPAGSSATEGAAQRKRKRRGSLTRTVRQSKKAHIPQASCTPADGRSDTSRSRAESAAPTPQFINFEKLSQISDPTGKPWIMAHDGKYYILRCEDHKLDFGNSLNPLKAAGTHFNSRFHGNVSRSYKVVLERHCIEVRNCDAESQRRHNDAKRRAEESSNGPHSRDETTHGESQRQAQRPPARSTRPKGHLQSEAVVDPVPGEIYRARCRRSRDWHTGIFIPRGCFGDPTFADVGLEGFLGGVHALGKPPECYRTCPETGQITDWVAGYEDGGEQVGDRRYPIMCFDDAGNLLDSSLEWLTSTELRLYDCETCASNGGPISPDSALEKVLTRHKDARAPTGTQEEEAVGDECSSQAMDLEQSESNASAPPEQPRDVNRQRPDTMTERHAAVSPQAPGERFREAIDRHETSRSNLPNHAPATSGHTLSSRSTSSPYISVQTFEPVYSDIVGHDASRQDAALRSPGREGAATSNQGGGRCHGPGDQNQAQAGDSISSTSYAVPPDGMGQLSREALSPAPAAEHPLTAVSFDGLGDEEARTLGSTQSIQPPDSDLTEAGMAHSYHPAPRPGHQASYGQSAHQPTTFYGSSAQLTTNHHTNNPSTFNGNWIAQDLPVPFETQQDPRAETQGSAAAEHPTLVSEAPMVASQHQGYPDFEV